YTSAVYLVSNDPARPLLRHPVSLHVTGAPAIAADPAALELGTVFAGASPSLGLRIVNTGTATLVVSDVPAGAPAVHAGPRARSVPARSSRTIQVTWSPQAPGPLVSGLVVTSNAVNAPALAVRVEGEAAEPPVAQVAPGALHETASTGDLIV